MLIEIVLVGALLYLAVSFFITRKELKRVAAYFGGPKPHPVLGNVLEFANKDLPGKVSVDGCSVP